MPRPISQRRAFTLMELVVVLMVISIVSAVAVPVFYKSLLSHQAEMAARRLKADIEMVRRIAQQTSSTQSVTFDGPLTYSTSAGVAALNNQQATYAVDLAEPPFEIQTAVPNFDGGATISFNGYGAPASGGQVVLTAGDSERTVRVDGDTGQVTIEDTSPAGTN